MHSFTVHLASAQFYRSFGKYTALPFFLDKALSSVYNYELRQRAEQDVSARSFVIFKGLKKLEDELNDLKVNKRKAISEKIKEAREQGDLSENAEYDAAKDEQRDIEARIEQIEKILKNAEVVAEDEMSTTDINVGCTVRLYDVEFEEELEFAIVGSTEANSLNGMISNESPVGSALLGKRVGDVVAVELANGEISHYKILEISRTKNN